MTLIAATDTHAVAANRTLIVGQVHEVGVAGAQTHSVGGSRNVNVNANKGITAASELVGIGGLRSFTVGGTTAPSVRASCESSGPANRRRPLSTKRAT